MSKIPTKIYRSKYPKLKGTDYDEIIKNARQEYRKIQQLTKRQPYVRSRYFNRDKVFINIFWPHLFQKHRPDQARRARFFLCAIDLLRNTTNDPDTIFSKGSPGELLYRFIGESSEGELFYVQVRQNKKTSRKDFMSVFPKIG